MKDQKAFDLKVGVCYVPENGDQKYNYNDFLHIARNNPQLAKILFELSDWQHPETIFEELLMEEEIDKYGNILTDFIKWNAFSKNDSPKDKQEVIALHKGKEEQMMYDEKYAAFLSLSNPKFKSGEKYCLGVKYQEYVTHWKPIQNK